MRYRKKPVVIDAVMWNGENFNEINNFAKGHIEFIKMVSEDSLVIRTLEGKMSADIGDYIIKGVKGEFYPCKPDIFKMTYEELSAGVEE